MRIVFANTFDSRGGAAKAAYRLFTGVHRLPDIEAVMVVQEKHTDHPGVIAQSWGLNADTTSFLDAHGLKAAHPDRVRSPFSVNRFPGRGASLVRGQKPDLAHLHWLHCGFMRIESLASLNVPLVWTIHDMWAFTGVCHYTQGCMQYLTGCGRCPLLASNDPNDISARVFRRKSAVYPRLNLTVISPSTWLARRAKQSPLLRDKLVKVIPNGIDVDCFKPNDKEENRKALGLPINAPLVMFGADFAMTDKRKGSSILFNALSRGRLGNCELVVFGSNHSQKYPDLPMKTHWLGSINDNRLLAAAYGAADIFVAPSLQENLSNTVMESLACGTPVVAFDIGGMPDFIQNNVNGFLVSIRDGDSGLRKALEKFFKTSNKKEIAKKARESIVSKFKIENISRKYEILYKNILDK